MIDTDISPDMIAPPGFARHSGHQCTWRRAPRGIPDTAERGSRATVGLGSRSCERGRSAATSDIERLIPPTA